MAISFLNLISENFYGNPILCNDLNDVIDVCAENIYDFSSAIKGIHSS